MKKRITKGQLNRMARVRTDSALARWFTAQTGHPITQQSVHGWGGDRAAIPALRYWQMRALIAEGQIKQ